MKTGMKITGLTAAIITRPNMVNMPLISYSLTANMFSLHLMKDMNMEIHLKFLIH